MAKPPAPLFVLRGHTGSVHSLTFAHDVGGLESALLSGSATGLVKLWDLKSRRCMRTYDAGAFVDPGVAAASKNACSVLHCEIANENSHLLVQLKDGTVQVWDPSQNKEPLHAIQTGSFSFFKCSTDASGSLLLAPTEDSSALQVIDLRSSTWRAVHRINCNSSVKCPITVPKTLGTTGTNSTADELDEKTTASTEQDASVQDPIAGKSREEVIAAASKDFGMCMVGSWLPPDVTGRASPLVVVGGENGRLDVWDLTAGKRLYSGLVSAGNPVLGNVLNLTKAKKKKGGGVRIQGVAGSSGAELLPFELHVGHSQVSLSLLDPLPLPSAGVSELATRADGKIFAAACWDRRVRVYGWKKAKPLAYLDYHRDSVRCVAFGSGPTLGYLASGGKDARIAVCELYPP